MGADQTPTDSTTPPTSAAESTDQKTTPKDPTADLAIKLAEAEAAAASAKDEWLRAKAETENIRRRAAEDVLKAQKFGVEKMADALLAVKDSMDAALRVENPSMGSYKQGVELTARQLASVLEKFSIVELDPVGQKFDPTKHQAIATVDSEQEANTVVSVMQKGYTLHERVLRPALVTVAKAKG
ncbi:MAG: nucleotide exchange factor GrpE [Burkholderiales bacterium]|jgi:molecular chaperone GrpE|nr:nucleotide exchange factor GrpE [Nitrosomonadaceae bacterium]